MSKIFRDAVHGDMEFSNDELHLIDSRPLQRLRGIKQLGTTNLVFPSANHTRFDHTLGTAWMTKRLLQQLHLTPQEKQLAVFAALLHDVTHVPFGHTFEDERRLFARHDHDADRLDYFLHDPNIHHVLTQTGTLEKIRQILLPWPDPDTPPTQSIALCRAVVAGTVCADLLDYLKRDAYFCGLRLGYDERIVSSFHAHQHQLVVRLHKQGFLRRDVLSELIQLLQIRYSLTERVYFHHAKVVSGAMISRAVELALDADKLTPTDLYTLRDDGLFDRLDLLSRQVPGLDDLMNDLLSRRLYKRVFELQLAGLGRQGLTTEQRDQLCVQFHENRDQRTRVEMELARRLNAPASHVIVYCPSAKMQRKEADVPVEIAPDHVIRLSQLQHPDIDALSAKHRGLWRFYLCVRQDHLDKRDQLSRWSEELIGFPNQQAKWTIKKGPTNEGEPC